MTAARILVVEDGPPGGGSLANGFSGGPFEVVATRCCNEALRLLDGGAPVDLVALGRQSRGSDSLALMRRLAHPGPVPSHPLLWQSDSESPEKIQEGLKLLGHYYLPSPLPPEGLRNIAATALTDWRARQALGHYFDRGDPSFALAPVSFSVRTLDEAQALAALLAPLCPVPDLAAMALSELLINGIEHGNLGIDFKEKVRLKEKDGWLEEVERRLAFPEHAAKRVSLTLTQAPDHWVFLIEDQGLGFDWRSFMEMQPERAGAPNGRGIALAHLLTFPDLEYLGTGAQVRATVRR